MADIYTVFAVMHNSGNAMLSNKKLIEDLKRGRHSSITWDWFKRDYPRWESDQKAKNSAIKKIESNTEKLKELIISRQAQYKDLSPIDKKTFDSLIEDSYRKQWKNAYLLEPSMGQLGASKVGRSSAQYYAELSKVSGIPILKEDLENAKITFYLYYKFRGIPEPPPSKFDKIMTKVALSFGAVVAAFVTAGAASAVFATAAPAALTGSTLVTGTVGGAIGINPDKLMSGNLSDLVPSEEELAGKVTDTLNKGTKAVQDAIKKAPIEGSPAAPLVVLPTNQNLLPAPIQETDQKTENFLEAGPSIAVASLVILALLSLRRE